MSRRLPSPHPSARRTLQRFGRAEDGTILLFSVVMLITMLVLGGMGLDIMRYRASLIGATLWIDSQPRRGTTVNCLLPRAAPARKKKR